MEVTYSLAIVYFSLESPLSGYSKWNNQPFKGFYQVFFYLLAMFRPVQMQDSENVSENLREEQLQLR